MSKLGDIDDNKKVGTININKGEHKVDNIFDIKLINKKNNKLEDLFISHDGFCGCKHLNPNFELTQLCKEENCNIKNYIIQQIKLNKVSKIFKEKMG